MRLAAFIMANVEPILVEWESFARSIGAGAGLESRALRDHAEHILCAVVHDMNAAQTPGERRAKSRGAGEEGSASDQLDGASHEHALERVESGFDLMEVVSEYRALRASVLRLWRDGKPDPDALDIDDITRFNESIDQSLTKAVGSYTYRVNHTRETFLGMLSHDLRNPLSAVRMMAMMMSYEEKLGGWRDKALSIVKSTDVIARMITDLMEFTRSRLGSGMPIAPKPMRLEPLCREVVDEFKSTHPKRSIDLHCPPELAGAWDPDRLRQAISNLIANALSHGANAGPVRINAAYARADSGADSAEQISLTVHNEGAPIPADALATIFDPLKRIASARPDQPQPDGLGLGLYIVRQIATAHGGSVAVRSTEADGTNFTLRLPLGVKP